MWILSTACGSGVHCAACRGSREFREQLARSGKVSGAEFDCPYGVGTEFEIPDLKFRAPEIPLGTKAKRLWRELRRWRKAGYKLVDREERTRRLQLCESCPHYAPHGNFGLGQCKLCGCTRAKLWLVSASCPHPEGKRW